MEHQTLGKESFVPATKRIILKIVGFLAVLLSAHSMARANLNKIEWLGDKCYRSIKVHTLEAQNLQSASIEIPLSYQNLFEYFEARFTS